MMKLDIISNHNQTVTESELISKINQLCHELGDTINGDITIKFEGDELTKYEKYTDEYTEKYTDEYTDEPYDLDYQGWKWEVRFKPSTLSDELVARINRKGLYSKVNAIDELYNTVCSDTIIDAYDIKEKDLYASSILENPKNYPSDLVQDLDELLEEMYKHNPLFINGC